MVRAPMRSRISVALGVTALISTTFSSADASARECTNPLVNTCIDSETYWPNPGPMRFATVAGTETMAKGQIGFGLVGSYISRPINVNVASPGPGGTSLAAVDNQINANFLFAYGVTPRLQLDFAMPVTFWENGAGTGSITGGKDLADTANRDLRFGLTFAIVPRVRMDAWQAANEGGPGKSWSLTARTTVVAPTGDQSEFAGERAAVFVPDLAFDYRINRFYFGAELGMRIRPVAEFAGARVGTQIVTALGAGVDILPRDRLSFQLEARAYPNFVDQHQTTQSAFGIESREKDTDKIITPAEWMATVRSAPLLGGDLSFFGGGGGPIPTGPDAITVPRWRFLLGVVYAPTERDSDNDGTPDRLDQCPDQAGKRSSSKPGCPEEIKAP